MRVVNWVAPTASVLLMLSGAAGAAEPCIGAKGDIHAEEALFAANSVALTAGKSLESAPAAEVGRLYQLNLVPQDQVTFAAAPGKTGLSDGYAGLAKLLVPAEGSYRVSVDAPLWIDVVGNGALAAVRGFQGLRGCDAPRKIVEFDLTGGTQFVLQISGSARTTVRVAITAVPK
jgi:hypothetical protein